jgi:hypothetical protein
VSSGGLAPAGLERRIHEIRGHNVLLDEDLAEMYGVEVRSLNQAVRRNPARFPADFMLRLTSAETEHLRSQSVISRSGHGGRRHPPLAFTEQGVAMLSGILQSERAVRVNVEIMRAFVRMRAMVVQHKDLSRRLDELEGRNNQQFKVVFQAIRRLMEPPKRRARRIGFRTVDSK